MSVIAIFTPSDSTLLRPPMESIVIRLRRRRARLTLLIRVKRVAQKRIDSSSHSFDQLRIGHLRITVTHPSTLNATAVQFSKNRLCQPLAIEKRLAMRAIQPGQRLFLF